MDELELLKKSWKRQEQYLPKIEVDEIYRMIHRQSSSTVKWIMIIAILEFSFWIALTLGMRYLDASGASAKLTEAGTIFIRIFEIVNIGIHLVFITLFVRNYRMIETKNSTTNLMKHILRTRKTVNYYVVYNIIGAAIGFAFGFYTSITHMDSQSSTLILNNWKTLGGFVLISIFVFMLFLAILWGFYRLIYGILLRRLKNNYNELRKIEP